MLSLTRLAASLVGIVVITGPARPGAQPAPPFEVHETTIAQVHEAMRAGRLTCRALVEQYLRRIDTFDKNGPTINAIVVTNPEALATADDLDRRFAARGPVGPLHCVPVIVKDNFETIGLQSANGSLSLAGFMSRRDAFQVTRIKAAGAIVLAKSNMAEWAFTPYETVSSILPGYTKNPYALDRVTAGSSGGTAAAVAASFGLVGLGTDTGNSIRGPSSHQALVGIRSTMGLTSRGGVMPLSLLADIAGPMARTVEDAVRVFQVIVGSDPEDPVTAPADAHLPQDYMKALDANGLLGARIGVLRAAFDTATTDAEVLRVFERAIADMRAAGATIVDPAPVAALTTQQAPAAADTCRTFKYEINRYLASHGDRVPVKSLADVLASRRFHPSVRRQLERAAEMPEHGPDSEACRADAAWRQHVRNAVTSAMDSQTLDAFVYPTWSHPPRLIGDLNTPHGDNSQFFSPETGFPAIQVPMGDTRGGVLPAGLTLFGRAWSEPTLIRLAFAYEQATRHRRAPVSTPPLR